MVNSINTQEISEIKKELPKSWYNSYYGIVNEQYSNCLHDACPECHGTGKKKDGSFCIHHISCPCPKCSPSC